jgi:hypothetical protein
MHKFINHSEQAGNVYLCVEKILIERHWYSQFHSNTNFVTEEHFQLINDDFRVLIENNETFPFVADAIRVLIIIHYEYYGPTMRYFISNLTNKDNRINLISRRSLGEKNVCLLLQPNGVGFRFRTISGKYGYTLLSSSYSIVNTSQIHIMNKWDTDTKEQCVLFLSDVHGGYFIQPSIILLSTLLYETIPELIVERKHVKALARKGRMMKSKNKK